MDQALRETCGQFLENWAAIGRALKWENSYMYQVGAVVFTGAGQRVDEGRLRACEELLKRSAGPFSEFRGTLKVLVVCKMALAEDPAQYFIRLEALCKAVKFGLLFSTEYQILAAMTVLDHAELMDSPAYLLKTKAILEKMGKNHPFLTSDEDAPFAAMLAVSGMDEGRLFEEMEACYRLLKPKLPDSNAAQTLSHVLAAYEGTAEEKCQKAVRVYEVMKAWRHTYSTEDRFAGLGAAAMLKGWTAEEIADAIMDADDFLNGQKGFAVDTGRRRMFAALLVLNTYLPREDPGQSGALSGAVTAAVAAAACTAAFVAASAARG